ncbi:molybdopterin biosynthesis protein [Helicobacter pylori]|nr:molybdopterin biosynthesis protein [Helicobacter pylori]BAW40489.1 molybdopterin biosynthesis protein [Helicobacter pylori]BAW72978.1 molybdopterin biosynthesis protein [Helicobacter pylori]GHS37362.1 hypothetical protein JP0122_00900 [Helicobacter pylori]
MISFNGFKMQDLGKKTQVIQHIFAGDDVSALEVKENECVKIMTGAMVPKGNRNDYPYRMHARKPYKFRPSSQRF